jgi:hypothetical protein
VRLRESWVLGQEYPWCRAFIVSNESERVVRTKKCKYNSHRIRYVFFKMPAEHLSTILETAEMHPFIPSILNQRPGIYSILSAKFDHHQDRVVCHFQVHVAGEPQNVDANVRPLDIRPLGNTRKPLLLIKSSGEYRLYLPSNHSALANELVQESLQNRRRK